MSKYKINCNNSAVIIAHVFIFNYYLYMTFQVCKIHSDFYYVQNDEHEIFTCKIREVLKKQKIDILVGDYVELSDDFNFIIKRLQRNNSILRPKVANIDLALVTTSFKEPELDLIQLNRYLIYLKYNKINCAICLNKEDLEDELNTKSKEIEKIYSKLGYKIFFISAKNKTGIDKIKRYIKGKTIVLCGQSGVGKTTLLNDLIPKTNNRTSGVSVKTQRGRHTTRHCEIIEYKDFKVTDTPGFSCLKFDFLLPEDLIELFDDIKKYTNCKYSNCLHNNKNNKDCSVINNLDKIDKSRYESYLEFLNEAIQYKNKISQKSIKPENSFKNSGHKTMTKISKKKRDLSRKTYKQNIEVI